MGIVDFHSLYINNNWDIQFVKHCFDVNTSTLNALYALIDKDHSAFGIWGRATVTNYNNSK
jgi:hypothetical protein